MRPRPSLSVIMPVLNGEHVLPRSLAALEDSNLDRNQWNLVIADDGSVDRSLDICAGRADQILRVEGGPRGPAFARNLGATHADGDVLVFVDADVCVQPNVLGRFQELFHEADGLGAVFGTYDDQPGDGDFLSQYRNLHHRYVHLLGAGDAETFWAGCGAVRRDLFLRIGGFDAVRYPRPQIEDIELGYRIRQADYRIVLDAGLECTHLKRWELVGMVRTDLFDRGVPWMKLLLTDRPGGRPPATLNTRGAEKVRVGLMGVSCVLVLVAVASRTPVWLAAALVPIFVIVLTNLPVYRWFAGRRGWWFAVRVVPLNLLHYLISGLAVVIAGSASAMGVASSSSSMRPDSLREQVRD